MKKQALRWLLLCLCILLVPATTVYAHEKESLERFAGTDQLWEQIPKELDPEGLETLLDTKEGGTFFQTLWKGITSLFSFGIRDGVVFFGKICCLLLFSALFRAVKDSFSLTRGEGVFDLLLIVVLSLTAYTALESSISLASSTMKSVQSFLLSSLPVTTVLLTLSGAPSAANTMASSLNFFIATVGTLVSTVLLPLFYTLFSCSVVNQILDGGLGSFLKFLKKGVKTLCILFFTLVSASLTLQHALSAAADSLAMRSVRFAAGNFIPVVGSLVGESTKILAASFSTVKTECGVLFILVLGYLLLRPILCIAVQKLFLGLAGSLSDMTGGRKQASVFLKELSELLDLLMALLISQGCYLIFYITLFLTNRGGL